MDANSAPSSPRCLQSLYPGSEGCFSKINRSTQFDKSWWILIKCKWSFGRSLKNHHFRRSLIANTFKEEWRWKRIQFLYCLYFCYVLLFSPSLASALPVGSSKDGKSDKDMTPAFSPPSLSGGLLIELPSKEGCAKGCEFCTCSPFSFPKQAHKTS